MLFRSATREPLSLLDLAARVNTNGVSRAPASVGISYTMTADATVQISIKSPNGRVIRTVQGATTRTAGPADVIWDLHTDDNRTVSANTYLVEVKAVGVDGHVTRVVAPLVIPR